MILTGKAKEHFEAWLHQYSEKNHNLRGWIDNDQYLDEVELPDILTNALIIEWMDSIEYYLSIGLNSKKKFIYSIDSFVTVDGKKTPFSLQGKSFKQTEYNTRQEATKAAIKSANNIFHQPR